MSKRSDHLCLAFCKCTETLTLAISHFGYALEAQFQASVVTYPRSICVPCSECRNFHHVWFMGVILSHYEWKAQQICEMLSLWGKKKKIIAAVDLIIFTTISFHSKYWSFLHFLFGQCFGQVFCASLLVTRFSEAVYVIFEF